MSNNKRTLLAKLAKEFYLCFPLREEKTETIKAEFLQCRSYAKRRLLKGAKYDIGKRQKIKANKLTDKIQISVGLKALTKAERKALFLHKQKTIYI